MNELVLLFWEFFKIGLFAIGGGPATLPFLMDLTEKYDWFTMADLTNMVAVSEGTPGPIGLNMATYAGFTTAGVPGAFAATFGLVFPSVVIIILVARFMENFSRNKYVKGAFWGIRPAVTALIASAVFGLWQVALFVDDGSGKVLNVPVLILAAVVFALMHIPKLKKLHPAAWFLFAAVIGIVCKM